MQPPATRRVRRILAPLSRLLIGLMICALPLCLTACMKASGGYAAEAPGYYDDGAYYDDDYGGDYGGEGEYDYRSDVSEERMAGPPEPEPVAADEAPSRSMAKKSKGSFGARNKEQRELADVPSETLATGDTSTVADPEALDVEAPEPDEQAASAHKRQIIYTATMQVSVYDVGQALEFVESLPDRYGGWLHQRVDNQVVLRIPAEQLEVVMDAVAELGVVDYRLLEALDVTAEYTDLDARIRVLAQMQAHLQKLLDKAVSVEQALEIRRALDDVTLELELARAQMRELSKSIAFSTLILRLTERGPAQDLPSSNDPFPWVDELGVEATDYR